MMNYVDNTIFISINSLIMARTPKLITNYPMKILKRIYFSLPQIYPWIALPNSHKSILSS